MTPDDFKRWRKSLGLKQKDAARVLGLKKRIIQYYEKGKRDGKQINIPLTVALACYAIANGIYEYDASELSDEQASPDEETASGEGMRTDAAS